MENSRQFFLLRKDILQKTVVGRPWVRNTRETLVFIKATSTHSSIFENQPHRLRASELTQ